MDPRLSAASESTPARLILDDPAPGSWNMAVDEALLLRAAVRAQPVLRFYRWSEPTLSLGYFQAAADRSLHPASLACPWVRRATGGGAILHDQETTYSFTQPASGRSARQTQALYQAFHATLVELLREHGLAAVQAVDAPGDPFLCFQRRATGDVLVSEHKICGSAQRRAHGAVLQHGSLLWRRSFRAPELPGLLDLAADLDPAAFLTAWQSRLAERLNVVWQVGCLTPDEHQEARHQQTHRYAETSWNERR